MADVFAHVRHADEAKLAPSTALAGLASPAP